MKLGPYRSGEYLSYEEITGRSLEELLALYEDKGSKFRNEADLLGHLEANWRSAVKKILLDYDSEIEPKNLGNAKIPPVEVISEGENYKIFGVSHPKKKGNEWYHDIVGRTVVGEGDGWLFEQGLGKIFAFQDHGFDVLDHRFLNNFNTLFKGSFFSSLFLPITLPLGLALYAKLKSSYKEEKGRYLLTLQEGEKDFFYHTDTGKPSPLPALVTLELAERTGDYSPYQQREAYMAECLKNFNSTDKKILIGASHTLSVRYFLENRIKEQEIVDVAGRDMGLLNSDPEKYRKFVKREKLVLGLKDNGAIISGGVLGLLPHSGAIAYFFT